MNLKNIITTVHDFPKEGIAFKDIGSVLTPSALRFITDSLAQKWRGKVTKIAALDARGFLFATLLSIEINVPVVMVRKPGKLPGETVSVSYDLEYGSNTVEMQKHAVDANDTVLVIDDLLATGGTARAASQLVEKLGGTVAGFAFVIELAELGGRHVLGDAPVQSLVTYGKLPNPIIECVDVIATHEDTGDLVLIKRLDTNQAALIGGKIDPEDTSAQAAAIRETQEETGLSITSIKPFGRYDTPGRDPRTKQSGVEYFTTVFVATVAGTPRGEPDKTEPLVVSKNDAPTNQMYSDHGKILEEYLRLQSIPA